jgi:protocatechuate 3,4-dioxygenase beta subunit
MEIASKGPTVTAGLLMLLALSTQPGCRCQRGRQAAGPDAGVRPATAAWLRGEVFDRRHHPVPAARVLAVPLASDGGASASGAPLETASSLDGHFRFENIAPGPYRLLVEAAGFPTAEVAAVTAPAADIAVGVDGEGRTIFGLVRASGAPVAGARVLLAPDGGGPIRETATREGGRFAFGGLGAGLYALRAVDTQLASAPRREVEAHEPAPDVVEAPVVLELSAARAVSGRVIDDAGAPLAAVPVRIERDAAAPGEDPLPTLIASDGAGSFTAQLYPDRYRLSASRAGYLLRRAPGVDAGAGAKAAPAPVVLELVRGARLYGRVIDPRGGAAAGARVRCVASAIEDLTVQTGPLPLAAEAAALPSGAGRALGTTRATVADRDGRFAVDDLIPGRYRIEVAHAGAEPLRSDELLVAPGERRDVGKLALQPGFPVTGRVVDDGGSPIDGARVVVGGGGSAASAGLFTLSDAGGQFALALPAGSYRLAASASGRGTAQVAVTVTAGASPPPLEIKLARAEATLEGLVRDDGGRPLARARLAVWPANAFDESAAAAPGGSPIGSGVADVGGHFTIVQLPAGDARLEVQHPDYPRSVQPVTPGKFANLTVPFPGGIAGEVKAKASGAAIARGRLEAVGPGGAKATADVRRDGTFKLLRLVPGHWRLTVVAAGYRNAEQELDVPPSAALGEASIRDLRVELDAT